MDPQTVIMAWGNNVHSIKDAWHWFLWLTPWWKVIVVIGTSGIIAVLLRMISVFTLSDKY